MSINHDVQVHSPTPARLYKSPSSSCSGGQFTLGTPAQETFPSLPLFAASFRIPIACTARTVQARVEPLKPRPTAEILLGIGGR
jgi:hypothetical protein